MLDGLLPVRREIRRRSPLIHCLTNHISIGDCANIILAVGAKPIMAEHPREVEEITAGADALVLNLGNITDERMRSMELSAAVARGRGIPITLDLVGVSCSGLRLEFAGKLVEAHHPGILKGNRAEVLALAENRRTARGVDAGESDLQADTRALGRVAADLAKRLGCVILVTGPEDLVAAEDRCVLLRNGHPMLGEITGTGCMLGALTGVFSAVASPLGAALLATLLEGVAGEQAAGAARGIGSFHGEFFDALYRLTDEDLGKLARIEEMTL